MSKNYDTSLNSDGNKAKARLVKDIKEAVKEMKKIKAGKIQARNAYNLLDELQ